MIIFFLSFFLAIVLSNSMHVVEEGHVGVYFRNGALQVFFVQDLSYFASIKQYLEHFDKKSIIIHRMILGCPD